MAINSQRRVQPVSLLGYGPGARDRLRLYVQGAQPGTMEQSFCDTYHRDPVGLEPDNPSFWALAEAREQFAEYARFCEWGEQESCEQWLELVIRVARALWRENNFKRLVWPVRLSDFHDEADWRRLEQLFHRHVNG